MKIVVHIKRRGTLTEVVAKAGSARCKHQFQRILLILQAPYEALQAAECSKCGLFVALPAKKRHHNTR